MEHSQDCDKGSDVSVTVASVGNTDRIGRTGKVFDPCGSAYATPNDAAKSKRRHTDRI